MKLFNLTYSVIAATLTLSFASAYDQFYNEEDRLSKHHHECLKKRKYSKGSLLERLTQAPSHYGCDSNLHKAVQSVYAAPSARMIGKVQFYNGSSYPNHQGKAEIHDALMSLSSCSSNSMVLILGYSDPLGCNRANFKLSEKRARHVREEIERVSYRQHRRLHTNYLGMGEEVSLCRHDAKYSRVAEIWLVEYPALIHPAPAPAAPVMIQETQTFSANVPAVSPVNAQPATQVVTTTTAPVAITPSPIQQLATILQQNVVTSEADRAELIRYLISQQGVVR